MKRLARAADTLRAGGLDEIEIWTVLKPALLRLVGWHRTASGPEALKDCWAWDLAANRILGRTERIRTEDPDVNEPWA